jgi:2-polyprenyl-3-methyl-5-hydroxy-6-metoxy-1,4-benzoquinol methylase
MIIHKLIAHHLRHGDDPGFYLIQAHDAIAWLEKKKVLMSPTTRALDLGCGHGIFGAELLKKGCRVEFADEVNYLIPEIQNAVFKQIHIDREDIGSLGKYDLVICSNVLEHLADPGRFIDAIPRLLNEGGAFYLSWTNWLSPWGGHEFSPFHYLGSKRGHLVFDKLTKRKRKHTVFVNLFPFSISCGLRLIKQQPQLRVIAAAPRYYPEFSFILRIPILREFLAWNCALLIMRTAH